MLQSLSQNQVGEKQREKRALAKVRLEVAEIQTTSSPCSYLIKDEKTCILDVMYNPCPGEIHISKKIK